MKHVSLLRHIYRLLPALVLLVAVAGLVLAHGTTAWTPAANLSASPERSTLSSLARDPATGDAWVAWTTSFADPALRQEVLGRRWDRRLGSWLPGLSHPAYNLSASEWADTGAAVFFDSQGYGHLLWTRRMAAYQGAPSDATDLMARLWNGTAWSPETVLLHNDSYFPGSYEIIFVQAPDALLLFVVPPGSGYQRAAFQDGAWSPFTPWVYTDVTLADIVRDEAGMLHAAAYGPNSNQSGYNQWFHDAYYLTSADGGTNWSEPVNLSYTDGVASSIGLELDGYGRPHFMWSDPDSPYSDESLKSAIWERVLDAGGWTPNVEVTAYNDAQAINGFALDAVSGVSDTLHLAWSEGIIVGGAHLDLDVYYQSGDGLSWGTEQQVYTSTAASRYPAVAAGSDGEFVAWQEMTEAGATLLDSEVYASYQLDAVPSLTSIYLPIIVR